MDDESFTHCEPLPYSTCKLAVTLLDEYSPQHPTRLGYQQQCQHCFTACISIELCLLTYSSVANNILDAAATEPCSLLLYKS